MHDPPQNESADGHMQPGPIIDKTKWRAPKEVGAGSPVQFGIREGALRISKLISIRKRKILFRRWLLSITQNRPHTCP